MSTIGARSGHPLSRFLHVVALLAPAMLSQVGSSQAAAQTAYGGVWRPGSGTQWWRSGMSVDQLKAQDQTYFNQGLRLTALEVKNGQYAAVWRPGTGAQWWRAGMSLEQFKAQDKTYFDQGLRLTALAVSGGAYAAVWRPGSGTQWWRSGMTLDQLKTQDLEYFNKGLRLSTLELDGGTYAAVWRPGMGAQWWRTGMTADQFRTQDLTYFNQGLRLALLEIAGSAYTAVWRPGTGAQWWHSRTCSDDFQTEDKAYFNQNLRLEALALHDGPVAIYRLPFDDSGNWRLTNGNYDDPVHGHPDTGHDYGNNQKYAFDFVYDSNRNGIGEPGQNIRAARDGVVYALVNSEEGNSYASGTTEETVKRTGPYPPGYTGVGNFLVVKHSDGTFGTYWHLQKGGIKVKVGDAVTQGQIVALSGNTGNSSTPHVHFDVRRGWSLGYPGNMLEYPSVKINFQDQSHACWIPRVGNVLASNNQ